MKRHPREPIWKLWEAFARLGRAPGSKDRVIDLGSCPGGWTWALSQLGSQVISVDTAPLDAKVLKKKNVTYLKRTPSS